jgi:alkylated DNA repair dioxygenase AlkB
MERYAITFGEAAIVHIGSAEIGKMKKEGFTVKELLEIQSKFDTGAEFIDLSSKLPKKLRKDNMAGVLVIRDGLNKIFNRKKAADKFLNEQKEISYDKKYYCTRTKKTKNKQARYNIVFGDENIQASEDYKTFTIKSFNDLKYLRKLRKKLGKVLGVKAKKLNAEGNFYYSDKSGIGFHGDAERKIVVCLSLGDPTTLRYCWRESGNSQLYGKPIDIEINHGDIYIMSEKATGFDWRSRSKTRLVHAAGNKKYLVHK